MQKEYAQNIGTSFPCCNYFTLSAKSSRECCLFHKDCWHSKKHLGFSVNTELRQLTHVQHTRHHIHLPFSWWLVLSTFYYSFMIAIICLSESIWLSWGIFMTIIGLLWEDPTIVIAETLWNATLVQRYAGSKIPELVSKYPLMDIKRQDFSGEFLYLL